MSVDEHRAAGRVVEAGDQHRRRGLPAAAAADDRHPFARRDAQVEPAQHLRAAGRVGVAVRVRSGAVAEADAGELDLAAQPAEVDGVRRVGDGRLAVEQLEDPVHPGPRLLRHHHQAGQLASGRQQLGDVGGEGEKRAQAQVVAQRQPAAEGQDGHLPDRGDRLEQRLVARLQPHGPHLGSVQDPAGLGDPFQFVLFLAERLDHADAVDVLVDDLHDVALALLGVPGGREDPPPHAVGDHQQRGHHHQADHGQQRGQDDHHRQREQHQQDVAAHVGQVAQQSLHERGVGVGPGHQLPGRHAVEGGEVHPLQLGVHGVAQVVLDGQRDPAAAEPAQVREAETGRGEYQQRRQPGPQRAGVAQDDAVDDLALEQRHHHLAAAAEHRRAEGHRQIAPVSQDDAAQAPDPARLRRGHRASLRASRWAWVSSSASPSQPSASSTRAASGV